MADKLTDAQVAEIATDRAIYHYNIDWMYDDLHALALEVQQARQQLDAFADLAQTYAIEIEATRAKRCDGCDSYEDPNYCLLWSIRPTPSHSCASHTPK